MLAGLVTWAVIIGTVGIVQATTLFSEKFNSDLSAYIGKSSGMHHGQIVTDPFNGGNSVLNFTALNDGGDFFSTSTYLSSIAGNYILSFDYLGLDSGPGTNGNLGGTIGYSYGLPGNHVWLAGTTLGGGIQDDILVDDGTWKHYEISFAASTTTGIHLMLEDWSGSGGIVGDAYFDNILLTDANGPSPVPIPASLFLFGSGLAGLIGTKCKRKKK